MKLSMNQKKIMQEIETTGETSCVHLHGRKITGWYKSIDALEARGLVKRVSTFRAMMPIEACHYEALIMERDRNSRQIIENRAAKRVGRKPKKVSVRK